MAQLPSAFNATEHEAMGERGAIPAGDYLAEVVKSEKCESRNKPGNYYWKLEWDVLADAEGDVKHKGRKLFVNLNLINANAQAVEIANKELKTICDGAGKVSIGDTTELHKIPMLVTVKTTPETPQYPAGNEITFYKPATGVATPSATPESEPAAVASGGQKKKAWEE